MDAEMEKGLQQSSTAPRPYIHHQIYGGEDHAVQAFPPPPQGEYPGGGRSVTNKQIQPPGGIYQVVISTSLTPQVRQAIFKCGQRTSWGSSQRRHGRKNQRQETGSGS